MNNKFKILILIIIITMTTIWGLLAKSLTDNETIEEAILRLVNVHNDDETAHLSTGQALQSHKASEIIDHAARSIIADKILQREIYLEHLQDFSFERHSLGLESVDGWDNIGGLSVYVGSVLFETSSTINTWRYADASTYDGIRWSENMVLQARVRYSHTTNQTSFFGIGQYSLGDPAVQGVGFKVSGANLYACWLTGTLEDSTEHTEQITGITLNDHNVYRIEYIAGVSAKFYVNDVLKVTVTTNLPDTTWGTGPFFRMELKNLAASNRQMILTQVYFTADY